MLSIAHTTTGAFIATKVHNPLISIPLILASHYLLDAVPHWDAGTGLSSGKKTPRQAIMAEIPDLIISGLFVIAYFQWGKPLSFTWQGLAPYWGGFLGLLPDFLEAPKNFLHYEPKLLQPLNRFHHQVHHSIPKPLAGIIPQVILLILIYLFK